MSKQEPVNLAVDPEVCIGIGQCEMLEPDVFRIGDDSGVAEVQGDGRLPRSQALVVIERCPSGAISLVD